LREDLRSDCWWGGEGRKEKGEGIREGREGEGEGERVGGGREKYLPVISKAHMAAMFLSILFTFSKVNRSTDPYALKKNQKSRGRKKKGT
jgi:hypothetical protein